MLRRFSNDDFADLESELRNGRPEPSAELQHALLSELVDSEPGRPPRGLRFALAFAFVLLISIAAGAFGGAGYASASIGSAAKSCKHVVGSVVHGATGHGDKNDRHLSGFPGGQHDPPWMHQYSRFVFVCYPFTVHLPRGDVTVRVTIVVPSNYVSSFVPPGVQGPCSSTQD